MGRTWNRGIWIDRRIGMIKLLMCIEIGMCYTV
jgi:hypothetical protein